MWKDYLTDAVALLALALVFLMLMFAGYLLATDHPRTEAHPPRTERSDVRTYVLIYGVYS